jgi:inorganic pyrophosphatase
MTKEIPIGPNPPEIVYCLVEIPKGGTNKYEFDHRLNHLILDRVLPGSVFYPTEYGYIPSTLAEDNDPLDIMVMASSSTIPGCLIRARVLGALKILDTGEPDTKIIAAVENDPRMDHYQSLDDLSQAVKEEIVDFWQSYAKLQPNKKIKVGEWVSKKKAYQIILESKDRWQKTKK